MSETFNMRPIGECAGCGRQIEVKAGVSYVGSTDGRNWHYGCAPRACQEYAPSRQAYITSGNMAKLKGLLDGCVRFLGGDPEKAHDWTVLSTPDTTAHVGTSHDRRRILISIEVRPEP